MIQFAFTAKCHPRPLKIGRLLNGKKEERERAELAISRPFCSIRNFSTIRAVLENIGRF